MRHARDLHGTHGTHGTRRPAGPQRGVVPRVLQEIFAVAAAAQHAADRPPSAASDAQEGERGDAAGHAAADAAEKENRNRDGREPNRRDSVSEIFRSTFRLSSGGASAGESKSGRGRWESPCASHHPRPCALRPALAALAAHGVTRVQPPVPLWTSLPPTVTRT